MVREGLGLRIIMDLTLTNLEPIYRQMQMS